jgi:hypothetical protein
MFLMQAHHLRAPSNDGGVVAEPPLSEAKARLESNREHLRSWDFDFQGRRASWLRAMARKEVLAHSERYLERFGLGHVPRIPTDAPLIVSGHQPELFHPGVWVKNFALGGLAGEHGAIPLNLIVDDDIPKSTALRVPTAAPNSTLRTTMVDFDEWSREIPYEDWTSRDEKQFSTFPDRVLEALGGTVPDPVMAEFGPLLLKAAQQTPRIGLRFASARRALEARWGLTNAEVPLSTVCETDAFFWFASHLLAYLPRFQGVHNGALARYRALYGIRSTHHPVPALGRDGDWLEAPFWVWRAEEPRRKPLMARQLARTLQLRIAGDAEPFAEIPLAPDREACCAVEQLRELPLRRIRLRTRALTTTMFARLLLGDLFIHGIGGAKYDELGDEIIREFFHFEPPTYLTLSMTVWLGLARDPASPAELGDLERGLRDLTYNPDRNLRATEDSEVRACIDAKRRAISAPVETRRQRVARFHEIRRCNAALRVQVSSRAQLLLSERERVLAGLKRNGLAQSREYSFVVHSAQRLRAAFREVALGGFSDPARPRA